MSQERLAQQLAFLTEIDKLKAVERSSLIIDGNRVENSAEHSWHLAVYALILAPYAGPEVDVSRAILMLLLHDIVEIGVGDHPIDLDTDWDAVAKAEGAAAARIFGLLPSDQASAFKETLEEFEAAKTPTARFAKHLDWCQPIFQTLACKSAPADHLEIVKENLRTGRASCLKEEFPEVYQAAAMRLGWEDTGQDNGQDADFERRLAFLNEIDALKTVIRATTLCDASRRENTGEHSWHIALYAQVLTEHAVKPASADRVVQMLLIHDLVEIDAGDKPIHGDHDITEMEAIEQKAADRIFGLLPDAQAKELRALWEEFEATETDDAIFAKSVDRVQPVISNLETGGGSWIEYNVSRQQLEDRVGWKVDRGAPALWTYLQTRIRAWFAEHLPTT